MANCKLGEKGCWKDGKCHYSHDCENKVLTHADRIRAMSDEEFVDFLGHNSLCDRIQDDYGGWCKKHAVCKDCLVEWLKQPVGDE